MKSAILAMLVLCSPTWAVDRATLRTWGMETYNEIERTLRVPGTSLYAETANLDGSRSGVFNRAFVWSSATEFRVLNTLTQINPTIYAPILRSYSDQLHTSYYNAGYRSCAGPSERFYDDNGHVVVALVEAYRLTHDSVYLDRAKLAQSFVMQGEDSAAGGGIYFKEGSFNGKDAISTLQGARGAAMLYRETGQQSYLNDATRLLTWANTHIQQSDGLYHQNFGISSNAPGGPPLVNSAGIGILLNLELYDATGTTSYRTEAERIATRTLTYYFDSATGRIKDQGYWAFELVDAFDSMRLHTGNSFWETRMITALAWLHDNKRDPNGHYGVFWGNGGVQTASLSSWSLNDQASVARAYLFTSAFSEPGCAVMGIAMAGIALRRCRAKE